MTECDLLLLGALYAFPEPAGGAGLVRELIASPRPLELIRSMVCVLDP